MLIDKVIKPLFRFDSSSKRHLLKAISWRVVGTIDTMTLAWLITGNPMMGLKIGATEVFTKIMLYYLHERMWFKYINIGLDLPRKIYKTIDWEPSGQSWRQVAFVQDEQDGTRKRVKVLCQKDRTNGGMMYQVVFSYYNSKTKERTTDIRNMKKTEIEKQLNITL
jgi:uncharacterized membrane protein